MSRKGRTRCVDGEVDRIRLVGVERRAVAELGIDHDVDVVAHRIDARVLDDLEVIVMPDAGKRSEAVEDRRKVGLVLGAEEDDVTVHGAGLVLAVLAPLRPRRGKSKPRRDGAFSHPLLLIEGACLTCAPTQI